MKALWSEDLSLCSLDEVYLCQAENRAWSKELRLKTASLVNRRLAKDISQDEYTANRKQAVEDAVECKRRAEVLANEIAGRSVRALPRWSMKLSLPSN